MSVYKVLNQLAATSSKNEKIAILKANQNNEVLKAVCELAYNPFTNFYIKKIPSYNALPTEANDSQLASALNRLQTIYNRELTGHDAQKYLVNLLEGLSEADASVLARVVCKDLRAGFSASTINKVWKDLIHEWPVMLASTYDAKLVDKLFKSDQMIVQTKLDGMRFNAVCRTNGKIEYFSRNGKPLEIYGALDDAFNELMGNFSKDSLQDYVFDGELMMDDGTGKYMSRQTGNGILSKSIKGTFSKNDVEKVRAVIWDLIPLAIFELGYSTSLPYDMRFATLFNLCLNNVQTKIKLIDNGIMNLVETPEQAQICYQLAIEHGEEGIILKTFHHQWEDKRSRHLVKIKAELEADLKCVGWVKGTGKNANRLGALQLETADGKLKVDVGSGFSDNDRESIKPDVVGKIITIKYNGKIKDIKTGQNSLFLPVFIEIRDDKSTANSFEELQ